MDKMGAMVAVSMVKDFIERAEGYENGDDLWNDAESFGQFVIERLEQFTELEYGKNNGQM